jgi:lipopolysaccharide export system permease protein
VYVGDRTTDGRLLRDIWIWQLDSQSRVEKVIRAESGQLEYDEASESLVATLFNAKAEQRAADAPEDFSRSPAAPSIAKAEAIRLPFGASLSQDIFHVKPEWLRLGQLQQRRAAVAAQPVEKGHEKEAAIERMKLSMILHEKQNLSLAVFAFAFVAVPLGIKVSRRETSANLGIAVLLVLGYYVLLTMVKWSDKHPEYRPDLLLWVPNLLFLAIGFHLLRRVENSGR